MQFAYLLQQDFSQLIYNSTPTSLFSLSKLETCERNFSTVAAETASQRCGVPLGSVKKTHHFIITCIFTNGKTSYLPICFYSSKHFIVVVVLCFVLSPR